jgi:predicted Abi (CAAX) family protease
MNKPTSQQVARAGEHLVAAEIHRRGGYAVTFAGNMPEIDILANDADQSRTLAIQVKTKRVGSWQTSLREWTVRHPEVADKRFWILVDLSQDPDAQPEFFIVPESWMQEDIDRAHAEYLKRHGGQRARTPTSSHHSISKNRVEQWRGRWDLLMIFGPES